MIILRYQIAYLLTLQTFCASASRRMLRSGPDAKTLLSHPWILKSKPALNSFRHSGAIRSVQEDVSVDTVSRKQLLTESDDVSKSCKDNSSNDDEVEERTDKLDNDLHSDQVPTLAIHEKSSLKTSSGRLSMNKVAAACAPLHGSTDMHDQDQALSNGDMESPDVRGKNIDRRDGGKTNSTNVENESFVFATRSQDNGLQKVLPCLLALPSSYNLLLWVMLHLLLPNQVLCVFGNSIESVFWLKKHQSNVFLGPFLEAVKTSMNLGGNELSKFSDTPRDASLDDLFHPLDKNPEDRAAEASTSASTSHMNQGNAVVVDAGKNDLATRLRATIAQKQMENEMGQTNGGGDLFSLMMGVLKDGVIDIDGLVFDEKLPPENLFPLQAVEFSRLVGLLRPEESEEVIVSACQKLISIFHQRPEQKIVFITQHGLLPLMELLEVPKTRVIFSVLQLVNQIVKDNTDFQENACLVGLIPVVMSFAGPDRPREVRMEAAYFLQQLCQSSSLTLQMFIACRGIPILVGFLEADHAKACLLATHDFLCVLFSLSYKYTDSPLKPHALPLLCDMAHASRNSREQLRAHGGLDVYLSLLDDMVWSVTALDSIAVCLAHDNDNHKVEQALLKKDAVQRLVKFFQCCPEQQFVHILEPFLKIITKSSRINTTLAVNGLTPLLIARLDHQDAIARLNLLKLIKVKFATPYCPVLTFTSALRNYKL
ncbi:hypothetical protein OIU78_022743 [Salix suchowensis]|nr:hypothetical protein OIU78_022743 [Salix suchowensis]